MSKVGILTFQNALNYGAIFQTFALQSYLQKLGYDVEVINYKCKYTEKIYKPFYVSNGKILNAILRGVLFGMTITKKKKRFNRFSFNHISLTKEVYDIKELSLLSKKFDYIIAGSDQVWSPISANFDAAYFLPFAEDKQKVSYAASIGTNTVSSDIEKELKNRLDGFSCLSVREYSAKQLLQSIGIDKEIYVHVDPTLLLQEYEWNKMCSNRIIEDEYLLIFNVEKPKKDIEFAKKYAFEHNLKIIYINDRTIKKDKAITYIKAPSPEDFLSLFKNANTVVTNSFHGTVFSIIFEKNFFVELDNQKQYNVRVEGLLNELEIYNREISKDCSDGQIDWPNVEHILENKRKGSLLYFKSVLGE